MSDRHPKPKPTALRRTATVLFFAFLLAVAGWAAASLMGISPSTQLGRIRAAICAGAMFLLFATFESIRTTHLKERYALLWVLPSLAILALAFFPAVMDAARNYFGMEYGSIMAGVAFLSLLVAVFAISRTISRNEDHIAAIARREACLEERESRLAARLLALEDRVGGPGGEGASPAADSESAPGKGLPR